jgi:DNA helicase-2/ATP-dependent DNA helicase PcrA
VPAYVVLSDADLRGVAERLPKTMAELRQCRGFGPTKLERYGDELLSVLEGTAAK